MRADDRVGPCEAFVAEPFPDAVGHVRGLARFGVGHHNVAHLVARLAQDRASAVGVALHGLRMFYTPAGVLADLRTLTSLPNDIFIEGLGEVAKSGFIRDPEILAILEERRSRCPVRFDSSAA